MLHVILKPNPSDDPADPKCAHLEIGDTTTAQAIAHQADRISHVIADGEELIEIIKHFQGIPKRFNRFQGSTTEQTWFGDDARFIVANW